MNRTICEHMNPQELCEECHALSRKVNPLVSLLEKQGEYIVLLEKELGMASVAWNGLGFESQNIEYGKRLRSEIESLKKQAND